MRPADLNSTWAELLIGRLAASGVRSVVVSPGARSAPLVLAAARTPGLTMQVLVDERSAAFFALGQARVTGRPSLLICTSGTAGAHYLPALIEASESGTPLLALTADRPPELHHRGAPQTIDQAKLYGGHVRRSFEVGPPEDDRRALEGTASVAALAVATTLAPNPGPVHLNAWLRRPLEPQATLNDADAALRASVAAIAERPLVRRFPPYRAPSPAALAELVDVCRRTPQGLIVCGPGPLGQSALAAPVSRLSRATGYPILAEATSQLRFRGGAPTEGFHCDFFDPLLRSAAWLARRRPALVLQVGRPPTSKGFELLLAGHPDIQRWVLAAHGWNDPYNQATGIIAADLTLSLESLSRLLGDAPLRAERAEWAQFWAAADRAAGAAVDELLADPALDAGEARVVRRVVEAAPADSLLFPGNSLPVREVDLFCPGSSARRRVLHQKGANGVDGLVSGAAGAASVSVAGAAVTLLMGDVACLHDLGGLAAAADLAADLRIVVINNGGGRLFELQALAALPDLRALFDKCFLTPPRLDIGAAAQAFGISFARVTRPDELLPLLAEAAPRPRIIEAVVAGETTGAVHRRLRELTERRLAAENLL